MKDLRRLVVALVIGSFSVAALLGIVALLSGGGFGETQGRVLLTTVIVGVESTVVLCLLTVAGHRWAPLGAFGAIASLVATAAALVLAWGEFDWDSGVWEQLLKTFGVAAILAATAAQLCLLIALILRPGRESGGRRALLAGTGVAATVVAAMTIGPILNESDPGGDYWRVFGVIAILDVLGTVVLMAVGAFGRALDRMREPAVPSTEQVRLSAEQERRISAYAAAHGTTPNRVVKAALDAYLS